MTIEIEDAFAKELLRIADRIACSVAGEICIKDEPAYVKKLKVNFGEYVALTETTFAIWQAIRKEIDATGDLPF